MRIATTFDFDRIHPEARITADHRLHHAKALGARDGMPIGLERLVRCRNEVQPIQLQPFKRVNRRQPVTDMRRVKTPAQEADSHAPAQGFRGGGIAAGWLIPGAVALSRAGVGGGQSCRTSGSVANRARTAVQASAASSL